MELRVQEKISKRKKIRTGKGKVRRRSTFSKKALEGKEKGKTSR